MTDRDELFETMGRIEGEGVSFRERERMVLALVRGEAQIFGARVRIEWVDPKPDAVDDWMEWHAENAASS
jgi:hypothetical protein